jgi:hypothetical protein
MNRFYLPVLLISFIVLGAIYASVTPLFEVSDELWHYPMVKTLADGNGLPVQNPTNPGPWRQEGSQPPLYYMLMAFATRWIDTSDIDQVRWINPHADNGIITLDGNNNIIVHTYREAWPWRGTTLAVRLIRLLSVLLGAGTVYFTYRLALELAPEQKAFAFAAAAFVAFTPMFIFVSASVNNDNLAIFLSAAALWLLARWLREPPSSLGWSHILLGLILGGAALSKESALGLFPLAGGVILWDGGSRLKAQGPRPKVQPPSSVLRPPSFVFGPSSLVLCPSSFVLRLFTVFSTAAITSFWWYWRNYQLYGDWLGWNKFVETVGRRPHPATFAQLWGERIGFVQAYWGLFGGVSVPMPNWTYLVLNGVMGLAFIGLVWSLAQKVFFTAESAEHTENLKLKTQRAPRSLRLNRLSSDSLMGFSQWGLLVAWVILIVVGLIRWTSTTWASQGRLIFPAISAISVLAVWGLARLWRGLPWLAIGFMALLSIAVPFTVIAPHYAPPPELTSEQIAAIHHLVNADFGGEMKLLGYSLETTSVLPGEPIKLTLYWQSQIAMDRNWSIFTHVVDDQGLIVAQRDRYPGMGALATTLMRPGQTLADNYVIPLSPATYSPAAAHLEVGLYDLNTGERLALQTGGDSLMLTALDIRARPGDIPNALRQNFGNQIQLTGYDLSRRVLHPGETLHLTLYWQALTPLSKNYSVFAHVRGAGESLWAGQDSWPQQGAAPTSGWKVGDVITDTYDLTLQADTPPELYDLEVGLYDSSNLQRLQLIADDGRPLDADFIFLSKVRVVAP